MSHNGKFLLLRKASINDEHVPLAKAFKLLAFIMKIELFVRNNGLRAALWLLNFHSLSFYFALLFFLVSAFARITVSGTVPATAIATAVPRVKQMAYHFSNKPNHIKCRPLFTQQCFRLGLEQNLLQIHLTICLNHNLVSIIDKQR